MTEKWMRQLYQLSQELTDAERGDRQSALLTWRLGASDGSSHIVGFTGPPGVGKSSTISALLTTLRERQARIAVLAVDPSSTRSGGALLGDRVRMQAHAGDPDILVRSLGTRGQSGGLALGVPLVARILESAGFHYVLIETVGVGQVELDIVDVADTTVALLEPGMGDEVQAEKAGILEHADILVVSKSDRADAGAMARLLARSSATRRNSGWKPPVLLVSAMQGQGLSQLIDAIEQHREWLRQSGEGHERALRRSRRQLIMMAMRTVEEALYSHSSTLDEAAHAVMAGEADVFSAAEGLVREALGS